MAISDLLDSIPLGAFAIDRDFRVLYWNRTLESWCGISKSEMIGANLEEHFPHLKKPVYRARLQEIFQGGPPAVFSSQLHGNVIPSTLPNGVPRIQQTIVTGLENEKKKEFYALFSIQDMTDLTLRTTKYRLARDRAVTENEQRERAERALLQKQVELEAMQGKLQRLNGEFTEKNRLAERDLDLARDIQMSLLPNLGKLGFLDFAHQYLPCAKVSGDVYDLSVNRENCENFFIGDATGHGLAASFLTLMLHIGFRSLSANLKTNKALSLLNGMLFSEGSPDKFITGIYLRITPDGLLTASNAGHDSLVILPACGGEPFFFQERGLPLGSFSNGLLPYEEESYRLRPGDRVFVYTDGIPECAGKNGKMFGSEKVVNVLRKSRKTPLEPALAQLMNQVRAFSNSDGQSDDMTIFGSQFLGKNTTGPAEGATKP
ncbi:MAG: SpoIIE family protein phosphatase [SAR324 cluster bacterium]|nr:SpoIIE family protein phosphatase [SAR324 cluster bacterium]